MNITAIIGRLAAAYLLFALAACGGGGGDAPPTPPATSTIGPAGGTLTGPGGAQVVVPAGALAQNTAITIAQSSVGAPALPAGFTAFGPMLEFTPHGTTFALPVTVTVPFDPASVPSGKVPALFKTNAQNQWEQVAGATFNAGTVSAQLTTFSWVQVGGLLRDDPVREWEFSVSPGDGGADKSLPPGILHALAGEFVDELADFGPLPNDGSVTRSTETLPPDNRANGLVISTANGVTYLVGAEAPDGKLGSQEPIGSSTRFKQTQSYIMLASNASLTFTLTGVFIRTEDFNPTPQDASLLVEGGVNLTVRAYKKDTPGTNFYSAGGFALVIGHGDTWIPIAKGDATFRLALWSLEENFFFAPFDIIFEPVGGGISCPGKSATLELKKPIPYIVDLSSLVVGDEFTLEINTSAQTNNRRGGGFAGDCQLSYANASLRDPLEIGGATLAFSGLEPTNRPVPAPQTPELVAPASCVPGPGPNPASGVLQFGAATFTVDEWAGAAPAVTVSRTGGSSGAVTATFTTSDGTAIGGIDYTSMRATVFFGDGEAGSKVVRVPILPDLIDEIDKTVNLTLSQPGGCAALGAQTTAVLTIRDDDAAPVLPSGLDLTFGTAGKASMPETGTPPRGFGGDRSAMALQADGKIVMVGGTFTDFILARFNADGSLDTGFGIGGKVTTDMGGGPFEQEEALGVAIQADGKIVVVGHTSIPTSPPAPNLPPTFALARYTSDGNLDPSFGTGGKVSANVNGIAYAVAIQPDGKIVVAGEFSFASSNGSDFSDFTVARFNANGSLDLGFGGSGTGQVATDIGSSTNSARNLVLQPNGAIVVSGKPLGDQAGFDHTDIARYTASGLLDASFGSGGKLTIAGANVGEGLARQSDGRFVLAGSVIEATVPATARFLLKRLNVDGSPDTTFGNAGTVDTAFAQSATAGGVALQGDGKIVVVGTLAFSATSNFIVARYNANGSVDTGFGSDGNLSIDFFGLNDIGENVLVQPDGKIVVSGQAQQNFDGYGLARINP